MYILLDKQPLNDIWLKGVCHNNRGYLKDCLGEDSGKDAIWTRLIREDSTPNRSRKVNLNIGAPAVFLCNYACLVVVYNFQLSSGSYLFFSCGTYLQAPASKPVISITRRFGVLCTEEYLTAFIYGGLVEDVT